MNIKAPTLNQAKELLYGNRSAEFCIEGQHFVFDPLECEIVRSSGNCFIHDDISGHDCKLSRDDGCDHFTHTLKGGV